MWTQVQQALNQSLIRVLNELASLIPGVAALMLAVIFSALIGGILYIALRRVLAHVQFDERLAKWGFRVAEWSPAKSPSAMAAGVVFWTIVLVGFLIGVAAFDSTLTSRLVVELFSYLPNVLAAALVLLIGNVMARFLARSILIGAVNMNLQYARILSAGVKWMILVLAAAMALEHLGIGGRIVFLAFGVLFGGIVLALALAVGLGSKELVSRSLERDAPRFPVETGEPFRHL
jgi:Conserved TM helix